MQVEQPHHAPTSLRGFIRQYAMIVLSILTALGLEKAAVAINDASQARKSRERIEAELARTVVDLKDAEEANAQGTRRVQEALSALVAAMKGGDATEAQVAAAGREVAGGLAIALTSPERDAWDTAVGDQSAGHLASADLRRYAEIYAAERDLAEAARLLLAGEWLTRSTDTILDVRLGRADARALAQTVGRFLLAAEQISGAEKDLEVLIETGSKPAATSTAPAAASVPVGEAAR